MSATQQQDNKPRGKSKSRPVALYPDQISFIEPRAALVGGVSKYFQMLADYDKKNNILPAALKQIAIELEAQNA